ncbi:perosamine synthetase [Actinoalloteichus cyanogriseus DSM 43889]|nr:perosamine synthetase [Actinoalloteichus caeruleus DSM 43889]
MVPYPSRGTVLGDTELGAVSEALRSDQTLSAGGYREAFERRFADLVGSRHAVSVTSGTVAVQLGIALLGLRPGDEVIATPQTYKATVQPLLDAPVTVRFCDVDPHTLNADPRSVEALITDRTRAILLVHYGGLVADMNEIMRIARAHDLLVLEDCAHALGSVYHGRRPGTLADIGCFSFHSSKNITTLGEGGMVTVNRDDWAERLDLMRSNESDSVYADAPRLIGDRKRASAWMLHPGNAFTHDCVEIRHPGTNATLCEPGAAMGLAQLDRLDRLISRRRAIAAKINAVLERYSFARPVQEPPGVVSAYHLYTFLLETEDGQARDAVVDSLDQRGVEMRLRYFPLHLLPEWRARGHELGECPVVERLWFERQINLPCQPSLSDAQVSHLLEVLDRTLAEAENGIRALART